MSSYARVMVELKAVVELKDNIVMAMPKITREGHYTCNVCVEYEWKPLRCSSCKVFGHVHEECTKNTGAGEKKIVKKPSQTSQGVPKGVEPTIEVSNSNTFDVLNSVDNVGEFGINGGTNNLVNNEATSSKLRLLDNDGNPLVPTGKLRLLDNDGNPLVPTGIVKSDSGVKLVFDETANLRIPTSGKDGSDKGYGTNNLLEQWRDSYPDNDDYDPYDDDMYANHDLSEHLKSIRDDLDFTVRDRKKNDSGVKLVFDETANLRIPTSGKDRSVKGYDTNNLLEQWMDSYPGNDDYDLYDDDMYENHDLSEHLKSIRDDLDITVRGRKKK
nr:hypothetical protein [Tanacetum cinerariifolium]